MKYIVHSKRHLSGAEGVYLKVDNWDDWFRYSTTYYLQYIDSRGLVTNIGSVKIGQFGMINGQRGPNLSNEFFSLDESYFSLGQSDEYYENLKKLDDKTREKILSDLRDMAYNLDIYNLCKDEDVTIKSLLRDISTTEITHQFHRIAHGGARLTPFSFGYTLPSKIIYKGITINVDDPATLTFDVRPESNPPTNIHVVIGRNGVGKTFLIKNIIGAIQGEKNDEEVGLFFDSESRNKIFANDMFANIICVGFSAFDNLPTPTLSEMEEQQLPYIYIGLDNGFRDVHIENNIVNSTSRIDSLSSQFALSLFNCFRRKSKRDLWRRYCQELCAKRNAGIGGMRLASDGRILKGSFQVLHVHILFVTPLGTCHMA